MVFFCFVERFLNSNKESSDLTPTAHSLGWIRKFRLKICNDINGTSKAFLTPWIDVVSRRRIQHIDLSFNIFFHPDKIPSLSIYTCETLVHLRLCGATLVNAKFVSLPCLKIIHLEYVTYPNESTLEKLISGSPVLEDLALISTYNTNVLHVRSQTLKRIHIEEFCVVIDAPLFQCLRAKICSTKNFEVINLGFSTKLDLDWFGFVVDGQSVIHDILTNISRVRDLVISNVFWKDILLYSNWGPVLQFRNISRLNAKFSKSDLEMLPTILESCPRLESFTLELVKDESKCREMKKNPKVMFSTVPQCLVTSLKFLEVKRLIPGYEGEIKLIRYFLKNLTILEKLLLDVHYTKKAMCDFLKELIAMQKCSTACEVLVL